MKTINKILAVVLFPIVWATMYISRIVWVDFMVPLFETIMAAFISPASFVWRLITLPIGLIIDIPVGFVVTLSCAIDMLDEILTDEIDLLSAFKEVFQKIRKKKS